MRVRSVAWAFVVGGWHRPSSLHLGQSGESPVEARVVVSGHLVGDIVVLAVVVVVVLVRSSHQGAVKLVAHGGPPVVRMSGELAAVSDLVAVAAPVVPVVAQQVVDLLGGPLLQLAGLDAGVSGYQGDEGRVTGVSVRAPLVVPAEGPADPRVVLSLGVIEVALVLGGPVHPHAGLTHLVLVAARAIKWGTTMEHSSVSPGKAVHLFGGVQKLVSVSGIFAPKGDGTSSHGGHTLADDVTSGSSWVDPLAGAVHVHVLGAAPVGVVGVTVSDLGNELLLAVVPAPEEVVQRPLDHVVHLVELAGGCVAFLELDQ